MVEGDRPLKLGSPRQRSLLALLLLHRAEPVSSERLIDELWGEQAPPSAIKIIQGHVSDLRKLLGDGLLATHGRGYMLQVGSDQTDLDRFESLVAEGRRALREGDAEIAAARLRAGLGLWRGSPLADFAYESFAQSEIARLEEARLAALEDRIDSELALGEHSGLVGELEALVREHHLRERFIGQLMLALYRSGRQAEALEVYREARRRLLDELGLEPGRELAQLERGILAQDPLLGPSGVGDRRARARIAVRGRRSGVAIAAAGAIMLAGLIALAATLAGSGAVAVRVAANSVAAIDARSNRVTAAVPVGARPGAVAVGSGSLWVANLDDQTISRIDPRSLQTLRTIPVAGPPTGIATSAGRVWVVESNRDTALRPDTSSIAVRRVDPEFNARGPAVKVGNVVPSGPGALTTQGNSVWVAPSTGPLTRLNAASGAVAQQLDPNASPAGIAAGEGALWISDNEAGNVVRVDPTGLLTPIAVGNGPSGITVGAGAVWVADSLDDAVVRIDPGTRSVTATIRVGRSPAGLAFGAGSVWVANSGDGTVTRIDPHTNRVHATITVGGSPQAITVANGKVWVSVGARSIGPGHRESGGGTLRMVSSTDVDYIDPALAYSFDTNKLLHATCAKLINYPDKAGPAGSQLTPEIAQALPARSADGRTYTFTIRHGFRFSPPSNEPVTARTFKRTIERTLNPKMHSPLGRYLGDVVGAEAYMAGEASHVAGVVASANKLTIRLLEPAPEFLARLAQPAFCAVPSNTPITPNGVRVLPSAGPYYIASHTPGQGVVLMRNPNYHGNRPHHFARIELAVGISGRRAVDEINAGAADYSELGTDVFPSHTVNGLASRLAARYGPGSAPAARGGQQYFINPVPHLDYFNLNTHRKLFRDVRMRQAVNYAIDRRALARLGDGFQPWPARPADHYLPPGIPGFRDVRVYPTTPDVSRARELANGRGRTAVLYTCNKSPCPEQAQIIKTNLAAIGIDLQIKTFPYATLFTREARPAEPFDLAWQGWLPDYFDPAAMLTSMLHDSDVGPTFDHPGYQRKLTAAARRSGPGRYLTYGELDLDLARNAAPLAAFGNGSTHDLFSARIGCQTFGIYGVDLAALCLRHTHS